MNELYQHPLVLIEWVDSRQPSGAWQFLEDIEPKPCLCVSVGYVVNSTNEHIALAPNLADIESEEIQCSSVITIPKEAIKKMTSLMNV